MTSKKKHDSLELWPAAQQASAAARNRLSTGFARHDAVSALCDELERGGYSVDRMVWLPERAGATDLNCGMVVDVLVEKNLALVVETDPKNARRSGDMLPQVISRGNYSQAAVLMFGDGVAYQRLEKSAASEAASNDAGVPRS